MMSARPVSPDSGIPPAMPLAVVTRSGTTPRRRRRTSRRCGRSRLHLVGDEQDVVLAAPLRQGGQEAGRRDDEATFTLDRFDDDRRGVLLADLGVDLVGDVVERLVGAVLGPPGQR
jgi:hypothetical protein